MTVSLKDIAKKFTASTFLLSVALFGLSDVLLRNSFHQAVISKPEQALSANLRSAAKLPKCLSSSQDPDIVLLGSSLMLVPTVRCDDQFENKKARYDRWYLRNVVHNYTDAKFFQHLVNDELKEPVKVADLAVSAGMQSDHYFVLQHYLNTGKKPKLIVLGVAPRDFLDNNRSNPTETPVFRVVSDASNLTDVAAASSPLKVADFAVQCAVHCYKARESYQRAASRLAEIALGRPDTQEKNAPKYIQKKNVFEEDLAVYSSMYLPLNMNGFKSQTKFLDKFLQLAQTKNIPVLLVDMPITEDNRKILPTKFLEIYKSDLAYIATKYGARLIHPEEQCEFTRSDFDDSVHLNAVGGAKLFTAIATVIRDDVALNPDAIASRQVCAKDAGPL